jgi:c-di-GMP-binding flagellar brake protein YcgR
MSTPNKRKHERIKSLNLSYVLVDGRFSEEKQTMGRTLNVSESGIRLETHLPVEIGSHLLLSIGLEDKVVDITGRVVHSMQNKEGAYELGVQFIDPDAKARETLQAFIKAFHNEEK